jgi:anti-anti-sigma regulatory factor
VVDQGEHSVVGSGTEQGYFVDLQGVDHISRGIVQYLQIADKHLRARDPPPAVLLDPVI